MRRQKKLFYLIGGAFVLLLAVLFVRAVIAKKSRRVPPSIERIQSEQGIPVKAVAPSRQDLRDALSADGTVEAAVAAAISPQIDLVIASIAADEGQAVSEGEVLVRLEKEALESAYRARKTAYDEAERNYARSKALFEAGAISRQEYDRAAVERDAAKARLDESKEFLGYTTIVSPLTGFVSRRLHDPGELASKGEPILEVVALDRMEIACLISETQIRDVSVGQKALIALDAYPGKTWEGAIDAVSPSAHSVSRLFTVKIKLDNPAGLLKPGMFARVEILRRIHSNALVLPQEAVVENAGGQTGVFLIGETGIVSFRPVGAGLAQKGMIEILSGLDETGRVALNGGGKLSEGAKVVVTNK